jgi:hypothetical protein
MSIYDNDVPAPDELNISLDEKDPAFIADWFRRVVLFQEAMWSTGRAVLVKRVEDERVLYLSSVPVGAE